jgi:hypothetical protein
MECFAVSSQKYVKPTAQKNGLAKAIAVSITAFEKKQNRIVNDRTLVHKYVCLENTMCIQGLHLSKKASNGSK